MLATRASQLPRNKRLHAETDAIHPTTTQSIEYIRCKRPGSALDRDLRLALHIELRPHRTKDPLQLIEREYRGRPSAQVNRVHLTFNPPANFFRGSRGALNVGTYPVHIAFKHSAREHVGREVAIAALGAAERNRNVDAQGHSP